MKPTTLWACHKEVCHFQGWVAIIIHDVEDVDNVTAQYVGQHHLTIGVQRTPGEDTILAGMQRAVPSMHAWPCHALLQSYWLYILVKVIARSSGLRC